MIGSLHGRIGALLNNGAVVVDVAGVGYEVHLAASEPPQLNEVVDLAIYTAVRGDAIVLYGFASYDERAFFAMLLATPGVGPTTALTALRTMSMGELTAAIDAGDHRRVATIPGIGAKTASRIVLELHGKVTLDDDALDAPPAVPSAIDEALRRLGYAAPEIRSLAGVELPAEEGDALRAALRYLGGA